MTTISEVGTPDLVVVKVVVVVDVVVVDVVVVDVVVVVVVELVVVKVVVVVDVVVVVEGIEGPTLAKSAYCGLRWTFWKIIPIPTCIQGSDVA